MESKQSLGIVGLLSVLALVAAVWLVARPSKLSLGTTPVAEAPGTAAAPSHDGKIALQFYRNAPAIADVVMKDVDGTPISTASFKGKVVIVNFWATWCPPCRAEIPDLIALQNKYKDQLQIIGISEDDDPPATVKKWALDHKMNYPI